jgi:hypothetical protein
MELTTAEIYLMNKHARNVIPAISHAKMVIVYPEIVHVMDKMIVMMVQHRMSRKPLVPDYRVLVVEQQLNVQIQIFALIRPICVMDTMTVEIMQMK